MMNPPLIIEGTTATHFADSRISFGIPLSGVPMISSKTVAADWTRLTSADVLLSSSRAYIAAVKPTTMQPIPNNLLSDFINTSFPPDLTRVCHAQAYFGVTCQSIGTKL